MGTSASSSGPASNISLIPSWVQDPNNTTEQNTNGITDPIAVRARFGGTRRNLRTFSQNGSASALGNALRQYATKGLGGSQNAARRMGGAVLRANALYGALSALAGRAPANAQAFDQYFNPERLSTLNASEIIDAIVVFVAPLDGSQDAEASQHAVSETLSDLFTHYPNANLNALTGPQIVWILARYLSAEINYRFQLDVGQTILKNAPSLQDGVLRLNEVRNYIISTVETTFQSNDVNANTITNTDMIRLTQRILEDTFAIFEEYV